jgi:hypothetical protein
VKNTVGGNDTFPFTHSITGLATSLTTVSGTANDTSDGLAPGNTYAVAEGTLPAGWDFTSASCALDGGGATGTVNVKAITAITVEAGKTTTCTFTNTKRGKARVIKTVLGAPPSGTQAFTFQLRQNASSTQNGTVLETLVAVAGSATLNFTTLLVPGQTYQLCEIVQPGWLTNLGTFVPGSFYPPDGTVPNPNVDNSILCVNFTVNPGETKEFTVDNTPPPGGRALTIGFWKNWSSCSGGKQGPTLDQTLALAAVIGDTIHTGHSTLPGIVLAATSGIFPGFGAEFKLVVHGSPATPNVSPDCLKAVRLLDKSRIDNGKKMASDPAFNLVAQLLAAELNYTAGAGRTPAATSAINQAVLLLGSVNFDGKTHGSISAANAALMNNLATLLDNYNNNRP